MVRVGCLTNVQTMKLKRQLITTINFLISRLFILRCRYHSVCQIAIKTPVLTAHGGNLKAEMIENAAIKINLLPTVSLIYAIIGCSSFY